MLEPLRVHNWTAKIEREVEHGEYLVLVIVERVLPEQFLATTSGQYFYAKQPGTF